MTEQKVSLRYAKAIYENAQELGIQDLINQDFKLISKMLKLSKELVAFLKSPIISKFKKKEIFKVIFEDKLNNLTYKFIMLLADKQREYLIVDIVNQYDIIYNLEKNILVVKVTTANQIDEVMKSKIANSITQWFGKIIHDEYNVNKDILGGILIRIDNWVYDATISHQLEMLRHKMILGSAF